MSKITTTAAALSALRAADDQDRSLYQRGRSFLAAITFLHNLRETIARTAAEHHRLTLYLKNAVAPEDSPTRLTIAESYGRTPTDEINVTVATDHSLDLDALNQIVAQINDILDAHRAAYSDFIDLTAIIGRVASTLLNAIKSTPARKRTAPLCDIASLLTLIVVDPERDDEPHPDENNRRLSATLTPYTLHVSEKYHRFGYTTNARNTISRTRGRAFMESCSRRHRTSPPDTYEETLRWRIKGQLAEQAADLAQAIAQTSYANYQQIGSASREHVLRWPHAWRLPLFLQRLGIRPSQIRAWYQFAANHNRIPGATSMLVSRPEAIQQVEYRDGDNIVHYTVYHAESITLQDESYRSGTFRILRYNEYWLDGPDGAAIPQSLHTLEPEENPGESLLSRIRHYRTAPAESQAQRRSRNARMLRAIRSIAEITPKDSHAVGNCVPGTQEYMRQLGISDSSVTGTELARHYRDAGFPRNPLFDRVIENLTSNPSRLVKEVDQST